MAKPRNLNIEVITNSFKKEKYTLTTKLTDSFKRSKEKLHYICPDGHTGSIIWHDWKTGHRCPKCHYKKVSKRMQVYTTEYVREYVEAFGYKLISEYKTIKYKIDLICPKGHEISMWWGDFKNGVRCKFCCYAGRGERYKKDFTEIKNSFISKGYELITKEEEYVNAFTQLKFKCTKGHINSIRWNSWQQGQRCSSCSHITSRAEQEIFEFISSYFSDAVQKDRNIISPLELDIIIPSNKIAIEYCGLYWHSENGGHKGRKYHLNKLERCANVGYRLITIFEDEFMFNKELVFDRLKYILGISENDSIYARKCEIKEITPKQARDFCKQYHTQGYVGSKVRLGAFFGNELVAVMTFSKPSIAKGNYNTNQYELSRFCTVGNVVGIASKLLKYFENNYTPETIFSYADRRWSDGGLYNKLGFEFSHYSTPNYWYIVDGKRVHRFAFRKSVIGGDKSLTEWEIMQSNGYDRIWDCGNYKFMKEIRV